MQDHNITARKKIVEAVSIMREKVMDGHLLLQHNIEYGLWRNLIEGSTFALLISIINCYILMTDLKICMLKYYFRNICH